MNANFLHWYNLHWCYPGIGTLDELCLIGNIFSSFSLCLDVVHAREMHSSFFRCYLPWISNSCFCGSIIWFLQILRRCGGSVELLDVSSELPQLVRRPGLKKWKVCYSLIENIINMKNGYLNLVKNMLVCVSFVIHLMLEFVTYGPWCWFWNG